MVPRTRRYGERAHATDHARGVGAQADGRLVALLERGAGSRWRGIEGVSKLRCDGDQHAVRDEPGRTWTGSPQGFDAVKKMGPVRLDVATLPKHAGYGCRLYASRPDIR